MADKFRYRFEDTNPVVLPVLLATVIEIGDMCWFDTTDETVKPASIMPDQGSLVLNQEFFHDNFVGIAAQRSRATDSEDIRLSTRGVFDLDTASAEYEAGDLVGPADAGAGLLEDQKVAGVATENLAVGRARKRGSDVTIVRTEIFGTTSTGGPQAPA